MSNDFWSLHIPPDSPEFNSEVSSRVGHEMSESMSEDQFREFERIIDARDGVDDIFDDSFFDFDDENSNSSVSVIDKVLYEKYPKGNWQDDSACNVLVNKQGMELGSFELKKELASVFWLEKNCPHYRHIVTEAQYTLHKEFGHGRVYFHPDLSRMFRDAITGANAEQIRAMFKKQKPCPLTVALGNRLLSRDLLWQLIYQTEKLATPPAGKRRPPQDMFDSLMNIFEIEIEQLQTRIPAGVKDKCQDSPGDKRLSDAIMELLSDEVLVEFAKSFLEADAKAILFSDDENQSFLKLCLNRNKAMLKFAYSPAPHRLDEDDYLDKLAIVLADLQETLDTAYGLTLKSGRE